MKRFLGSERGADLLLWLAVTAPVLLADEAPAPRGPLDFPVRWLEVAAVPLLALAVAVSRRRPVVAAAVPAALALAATPELYTEQLMVAQLLLSFRLGRRTADLRTGVQFFAGVCLAALALLAVTPDAALSDGVAAVTNALLTIMLPALAGRYARQHDELARAGWEAAEQMRLVERGRIARDMHDSLGHELSLLALRAAALQVNPALDASTRKAAADLRASAAGATQRLSEIISVLREDGELAPVLPADDTVGALVERAAAAGMAVRLEGELPRLPAMADRAAYRVVQEALTNAAKHAPDAPVTVRLGVDPAAGEAVVCVANGAQPAEPPARADGGYGLVGLDERVRLAGGRLRAEAVDGGFEVTARLPLAAAAAPERLDPRRAVTVGRRGIIDAMWVPVAAATALLALTFAYGRFTSDSAVLERSVFERLRVGQSRASVESRLPAREALGGARPASAPADPRGTDRCRFYHARAQSPSPVYRLCFADGRLSHKDELRVLDD